MNEIQLPPPNLYWGLRSGMIHPARGPIFKGKRMGIGRGTPKKKQPNENKGGVGRKARRLRIGRGRR